MDYTILGIILFIVILVIVGVIVYILYDYMGHKNAVDTSFKISEQKVEKVDEEDVALSADVAENTTKIFSNENKINSVDDNVQNLDKEVDVLETGVTRNTQSSLTNSERITNLNQRLNITSDNAIKHDDAIKKYFKFYDNDVAIDNDKLFEHTFSGVQPNLDIISKVTATSGLIVKTPEQESNDKYMKICNENKNCVNMHVNSKGFNITPDNLNSMSINSKDNQPMALFDMETKSIYLGGSDINSPLFIQNGQPFVNNINMIQKDHDGPFTTNEAKDMTRFRIQNTELKEYGQLALDSANDVQKTISNVKNIDVFYELGNQMYSNHTEILNRIAFMFHYHQDIEPGHAIKIRITFFYIGSFIGTLRTNPLQNPEDYNSMIYGKFYVKQLLNGEESDFLDLPMLEFKKIQSDVEVTLHVTGKINKNANVIIEISGFKIIDGSVLGTRYDNNKNAMLTGEYL